MITAAFWGSRRRRVAGGVLLGVYARVSNRVVGLVMVFGAGVLISAVAFELTEQAHNMSSGRHVVGGLVAGSLVFFLGD